MSTKTDFRDQKKPNLIVQRNAGVRTNALLASTESPEILGGLWNDVVVELNDNPSLQLSSEADVQITPLLRH